MAIKHERPTQRRMMLQFDRNFLECLPLFKQGLGGNEMALLTEGVRGMGLLNRDLRVLDVGSADGDWLQKIKNYLWAMDRRSVQITALEPVSDNPKLEDFCQSADIEWVKDRIEECDLPDESFDVITSTHCAYYFYNQPLAHQQMWRLLKPGGKLIVTLVSQSCVLNRLTQDLLNPHHQFTLTAEAYMSLMAKLEYFQLEKMTAFRGELLNTKFYKEADANLKALAMVLARHRLPHTEVDREMDRLSGALEKHQASERVNFIMYFEKAKLAVAETLKTEPQEEPLEVPPPTRIERKSFKPKF